MSMPHKTRLITARKAAGYKSARAAAFALGVPVSTYGQQERGTRGMSLAVFDSYMQFFEGKPDEAV